MTRSSVSKNEVTAAIRCLADLTNTHFEREQALLNQGAEPGHRRDGDYLIDSLAELIASFAQSGKVQPPPMAPSSWLNNHVADYGRRLIQL